MKISELLNQDKVTLSFEVFPPKKMDDYTKVSLQLKRLSFAPELLCGLPMGLAVVPANPQVGSGKRSSS